MKSSKGLLFEALQGLQRQALKTYRHQVQNCPPSALKTRLAYTENRHLLDQLKHKIPETDTDSPDRPHPMDLVALVFEYLLEDNAIPDSARVLLSYLHIPYLKLVYLDRESLEQAESPARQLLDLLAEVALKWVDMHGNSPYGITALMQDVVGRVLTDFTDDEKLFEQVLHDFALQMQRITRSHDQLESRTLEKIQGEEQLLEVKLRINHEIHSRIDGVEMPAAVLLLLLQPWSDYLSFILLRYGEHSEAWRKALQTTDDVMWSVRPKFNPAERAFQQDLHADLLERLQEGLVVIGYDQSKAQKLIDALIALQRVALLGQQVAPAPAAMRQKLEALAAKKAWRKPELAELPSADEERILLQFKDLGPGSWVEQSSGKRLKVAFFNGNTQHFVLIEQSGKTVVIVSALELARAVLGGKTRILLNNGTPFFERAQVQIYARGGYAPLKDQVVCP